MSHNTRGLKNYIKDSILFLGYKKLKHAVKMFLAATGLVNNKYKDTRRFEAILLNKTVIFNTEDPYSNSWFFPRYEGGSR